jgi:hypothetical protein
VPACVFAEGTGHLVGLGPPAQLRDAPALQDGLAIDGILKPFQRRLQVLDACLKRRDPELPTYLRPHLYR